VTAWELARRGFAVTVLEAAPMPGGRTSSYVDARGREVDTGLHVVADHYLNLLDVLGQLRVSRHLRWIDQHLYLRADRQPLEWYFTPKSPPLHLWRPAREMPLTMSARLFLTAATARLASYSQEDLSEFDDVTYAEWHRSHRLGDGFLRELTDAAADATTFLDAENASARSVLSWIKYMARNRHAGHVGLFVGSLYDRLVSPLVRAIEGAGGVVRLSTAAVGLCWRDDRLSGVRAQRTLGRTPHHRADGRLALAESEPEVVPADFVVSALPVQGLRVLLKADEARAADLQSALRLTTTPAMSLIVWFDRPITSVPPGAPLVTGAAMRDFIDLATIGRQPAGATGAVYQFVLTRFDRTEARSDAEHMDRVIVDLHRVWPASKAARVVDYALERIESSMFAAVPGAHALRPATRTSVPNLMIAGDWTRHTLNASMEGAAWSGRRAASAVLESLGAGTVPTRSVSEASVVPWLRTARQRLMAMGS
jgi:uncharacterized protein with NAD-binding domain and iron-sulfur cluster